LRERYADRDKEQNAATRGSFGERPRTMRAIFQPCRFATRLGGCLRGRRVLWSCAAFEPTPFEHTTFPLECRHATLACDSCHTADLTTPIATACESCHLEDAPASHGPERTTCGAVTTTVIGAAR
jgi:hypothetical protein